MIIIDYGVGNIGSIINMFKKIGVKAKFSSDKNDILTAEKLLLPGVGAFDKGMQALKQSGLIDLLERKVLVDKTPILGICLGMQMLLEGSEEGNESGLGWIKGYARKFSFENKLLKVPHMGWNKVNSPQESKLLSGLQMESRFYFVHSYHAVCQNSDNVLTLTHYGYDFASSIGRENIYGTQFHPEKSHKFGMQLLKNFVEL